MDKRTQAVSFRLTKDHNRKLEEMTEATYGSKTSLVKTIIDAEYERFLRRKKKD